MDQRNDAQQRIWNDSAEGMKVIEPDAVAHSPEAINILISQGADAYAAYLKQFDQG